MKRKEPEPDDDSTTDEGDDPPSHIKDMQQGFVRKSTRPSWSEQLSPAGVQNEYMWHPRWTPDQTRIPSVYFGDPNAPPTPFGYWSNGTASLHRGRPRDRYLWDGIAPIFASVLRYREYAFNQTRPRPDQSPLRKLTADAITVIEDHAQRMVLPSSDEDLHRSVRFLRANPALPNPFTPTERTYKFRVPDNRSGAKIPRRLTADGAALLRDIPRKIKGGKRGPYFHRMHIPPSRDRDGPPPPPPPPPGAAGIAV